MLRLCVEPGCPALVRVGRCPQHRALAEARRGTRQQRGYGREHDIARRALAASLPAPCHYCHRLVLADTRWDAAHLVDGHPEYGWEVAHPACNQDAKA